MLIPVQHYYRMIPACGKCAIVGHRKDSCPNPRLDTFGLCTQQVLLVEESVRAPRECVPMCSVCDGQRETTSSASKAKYGKPKMAAQHGGPPKRATKKRHHLYAPTELFCRVGAKTDKPGAATEESGSSRRRHR
ncbi:hypothetical protein HPB50_007114 [Hyalomma asiaticum]|uniref:Uncharacterized protein n=1 Tax=Hyalomma asiaticum TaxID=266040 RepID=A0ACB7RQX7_HYAAI|nr:hypothetical protein HPB50_007114 [Hyalomma asiaticum]